MQNLNSVTLIGRVGTDPESKDVNGAAVCQFRMATNRAWTTPQGEKKEVATWHRIVTWNKTAEVCQQYVHKGMMVFVTGSLETREYEKNGEKRSITEVRAQQVGFLSGREKGQAAGGEAGYSAPAMRGAPPAAGRGQAAQGAARQGTGQGWGSQQSNMDYDAEVPF